MTVMIYHNNYVYYMSVAVVGVSVLLMAIAVIVIVGGTVIARKYPKTTGKQKLILF